ncbi:MAG: hypothetical protein NC225_00835 [Clostridium sp.]|nr:hypothetical protein [Clostridium sp.]MCM1398005.1 hypothetical protein [Clostridium sp.]MCM1459359.1 hypothetical protein [Bacteroides sp.]
MADAAVSGIISNSRSYIKSAQSETSQNELDKDAFLQLLVTQMQYQDPLNPGDSTEYMSQLAQYSSLEATMNISNTLEKGNALNLVGEYVIMNTTNASGKTVQISGLVEYATVKDGDVLLSINDTYYPAEDLDSVVDYEYYLFLQEQAKKAAEEAGTNTEGGDDVSKTE